MNKYRTHNCDQLRIENDGENIILSGWINKKRDHGNLLFVDLRDNYGVTQCVIDGTHKLFREFGKISNESVLKVSGQVVSRSVSYTHLTLPTICSV